MVKPNRTKILLDGLQGAAEKLGDPTSGITGFYGAIRPQIE